MTKKQKKVKDNMNRVWVNMNIGTRTHKNQKDYDRKKGKKICQEYLTN